MDLNWGRKFSSRDGDAEGKLLTSNPGVDGVDMTSGVAGETSVVSPTTNISLIKLAIKRLLNQVNKSA